MSLPDPPAFRRDTSVTDKLLKLGPSPESQAAILELLAIKACHLQVRVRTHAITHHQVAREVHSMRHLLDEIEGKA